jgi:hypothetical protein
MTENREITMNPAKRNRRISLFVEVLDLAILMRRKTVQKIQYSLLKIVNKLPENIDLKNPTIVSIINIVYMIREKDKNTFLASLPTKVSGDPICQTLS